MKRSVILAALIFTVLVVRMTTGGTFELFSSEEVDLTKSNLVAIFKSLGKEYTLSFELKPASFLGNWPCILHLTIGGYINSYGDRTPGIWLKNDGKGTPFICSALNSVASAASCFYGNPFPINNWSSITIKQLLVQNTYYYTTLINGVVIHNETNSNAGQFSIVKVFAGRNPWNPPINGLIRNLAITNATWESLIIEEADSCPGNLVAVLNSLPKEYLISVEVLPTYFESELSCVIHFSIGEDLGSYGDRAPAVWFYKNGSMQICSAINGNANLCVNTEQIAAKKWSKIEIMQVIVDGVYTYSVNINGKMSYKTSNNDARNFLNVKVYFGDPWYTAQPGFIRNLVIYNAYGVTTYKKNFCKPPLNLIFTCSLVRSELTVTLFFNYTYQPGKYAHNVTIEYILPPFVSLTSESALDGFFKEETMRVKYKFPGNLSLVGSFNHSINATLKRQCSQLSNLFAVDIPVKISFQNSAGKVWNQYKTFREEVTMTSCKVKIPKDMNSLPESNGRAVYWDVKNSHIYVCMNQHVKTAATACYYSDNNGEYWQDLDTRIGFVLGHHSSTGELCAIHRNQKTYLIFHNIQNKWIVLSNNQFKKDIFKNIDQDARRNLEEDTNDQIFTLGTNQWMGNSEGLFFRKLESDSWLQRFIESNVNDEEYYSVATIFWRLWHITFCLKSTVGMNLFTYNQFTFPYISLIYISGTFCKRKQLTSYN